MKKTFLAAAAFALLATSASAHVFEDFRCGPYKVTWLIGKYFSPEPDGLCEMKGSCDGEGHYLVMRDDQRTVVDQQVYTKGGDLFYKGFKCRLLPFKG